MPRLLVIIDEFATLKAELPEFIDALVGRGPAGPQPRRPHAARHPAPAGRDQRQHPGQHQHAHRPADAGHERLEATSSTCPTPAAIPRTAPGPGLRAARARRGRRHPDGAVDRRRARAPSIAPVDVAPFVYGPQPRRPTPSPPTGSRPDACRVPTTRSSPRPTWPCWSATINEAFARTRPAGAPPPVARPAARRRRPRRRRRRRPRRRQDPGAPPTVLVALADDPDAQTPVPGGLGAGRRQPDRLRPRRQRHDDRADQRGAVAGAGQRSPDDLHVYALDFGAGELERPRPPAARAAAWCWPASASARRASSATCGPSSTGGGRWARPQPGAEPAVVTVIDGWSAFVAEYNDYAGNAMLGGGDPGARRRARGRACIAVIAADRAMAVTSSIASLVRQRWAHAAGRPQRLQRTSASAARPCPRWRPGRALVAGSGQLVQIARPADGAGGRRRRGWPRGHPPAAAATGAGRAARHRGAPRRPGRRRRARRAAVARSRSASRSATRARPASSPTRASTRW